MKKIMISIIFILLIVVNFYCPNNALVVYGSSCEENDITLITYNDDYLVTNIYEYNEELGLKDIELDIYETNYLIETIISSEINNVYYYNSLEEGIRNFKNNNVFFRELLTRNDAVAKLIDYYANIEDDDYDGENNLLKSRIELLLSQEEILNLCSNHETLQINNLMFIREQTYMASDLNNYEIDLVNSQLLATNVTPPYTPNGTEVEYAELFSGQDFTQSEINDMTSNDSDKLGYSDNVRLSNPSKRYNCHSYAWYSQDILNNNYWISFPNSYIWDSSYIPSTGDENDILCYFAVDCIIVDGEFQPIGDTYISHSAIISDVGNGFDYEDVDTYSELVVTSKWGQSSLFTHNALHCPYISPMIIGVYNSTYVYSVLVGYQIYKPFTHNSYNLSGTINELNISRTINGNGTITDKYGMYELNVSGTNNYLITIQSNYALDNRMYNENMGIKSMTTLSSSTNYCVYLVNLSTGTYYLRTAFTDLNNSGTVSISIEPHTHSYTMQYYNYKWHKLTCECGQTTGSTQVHTILQSEIVNGRYAECLGCHHLLDLNSDMALVGGINSASVTQVTINGSYILPSGIVVLVDEDLDAYLNGTLVFYDKDKVPVIQ